MKQVTAYIQLEAEVGDRYDGSCFVRRVKAVKLTQRRPTNNRLPVVKVVLSVPEEAFLPLNVSAEVDVPGEWIQRAVIVEVENNAT